ncbi:MAG: efflux RND transporter permease subunit [Candidatus Omnitrophota bacterium]
MQKFFHTVSRRLPKDKTVWAFTALTAVSIIVTALFVNLVPQVDDEFFFSSNAPQFKDEERISDLFLRRDTQLIISATGDIHSQAYFERVDRLTQKLVSLPAVTQVKSITNGPRGLNDAVKSPLWNRLLISDSRNSTNLIVVLHEQQSHKVVSSIENIVQESHSSEFQLRISGLPYVVELISRYLSRDLKIFSLLTFLIFGCAIFFIFRSYNILAGTMIACLNACMWTLMITDIINIPIGLLTANLATIIVVLTLSHMVFMTYNWKQCRTESAEQRVPAAVKMTFPASFWSMITTLLGFVSLLFVPAKPLRELGIAGAIGSAMALIVAYSIYPAFLRISPKGPGSADPAEIPEKRLHSFLQKKRKTIRFAILFFCLLAIPGIPQINTDPSLLAFFSPQSKIYKGLEYIDRNGGSSPLIVVVKSEDGSLLNSEQAYRNLWDLQRSFERHNSVGSVISLPVLMAEAKQEPFAFLLFWDWLLDILEQPKYGEIAKSFVSKDRQYGLFLLRMNELNRRQGRLEIIDQLKTITAAHGFVPEITGGVFKLQGHLAKLVAHSLITGLLKLFALFIIIAWIASAAFGISLAMIASLVLIPVGILGAVGLYGIPLDVISSPASNVAIAMGIDYMIHLIKSYRRHKQRGLSDDDAWQEAHNHLWQPILTSMIIVGLGFAIFLFSSFPPSQRFGGSIVFGTLLAGLTALYIMPPLAQTLQRLIKKPGAKT